MPDHEWMPLGYGYDSSSGWYFFTSGRIEITILVMHYDGYAFSINGQPTITVVSTGRPAPVNTRISQHDYAQINALYCGGAHGDGSPGGGDDCIDQHPDCAQWAAAGECQINPGQSFATVNDQ